MKQNGAIWHVAMAVRLRWTIVVTSNLDDPRRRRHRTTRISLCLLRRAGPDATHSARRMLPAAQRWVRVGASFWDNSHIGSTHLSARQGDRSFWLFDCVTDQLLRSPESPGPHGAGCRSDTPQNRSLVGVSPPPLQCERGIFHAAKRPDFFLDAPCARFTLQITMSGLRASSGDDVSARLEPTSHRGRRQAAFQAEGGARANCPRRRSITSNGAVEGSSEKSECPTGRRELRAKPAAVA
jgi:hypothetical protein